MATISSKSKEIIEKVIEMLQKPEYAAQYNQSRFMGARRDQEFNICGTECCLAGFMVCAADPDYFEHLTYDYLMTDNPNVKFRYERVIQTKAEYLLLDDSGYPMDTYNLFDAGAFWPEQFSEPFRDAETREEKAAIAVKRLQYFIEVGQ